MENENQLPVVANPFAVGNAQQGHAAAASDQSRAIAEVQASIMLAKANPRDERRACDKIINAFSRTTLAEVAQYQYARGGTSISGPSIRSAETIAQFWGNIQFGFRELSRGRDERGVTYSEIEAFGWDLENNTKRSMQFRVSHWRDTKQGGYPLKDERDIYELMSNQAQRRVRACILAIIPGDVVDAAMNQAEIALNAQADTSPAALNKMVEMFEPYGVTKDHIEKRIQRRLNTIQPAQIVGLRKVYNSIKDGMSSPGDWFEIAADQQADTKPAASRTQSVKEKAQAKAAAAKPEAKPKQPEPQPEPQAQAQQGPGPQPGDENELTFAYVNDRLQKAKTIDMLDLDADLIKSVPGDELQQELTAIYWNLRARLGGDGAKPSVQPSLV